MSENTANAVTGGTGPTLRGSVVDTDGWPLPGVAVTALAVNGGQGGRGVTGPAGDFEFPLSDYEPPLTLVLAGIGLRPYAHTVPPAAPGTDLNVGRIVLGSNAVDHPLRPGRWEIDPAHTIVKATARHLGMTRVEGRFNDLSGWIDVADTMQRSSVTVRIVAASLTTGNADRDTHLHSADFLDVERFPQLVYRSTAVNPGMDGSWRIEGLLTVRDITRPISLAMTHAGAGPDPWGGTRAAFTATTQLIRKDFEMDWNMGLPGGMLLVGPTLRIDLDVQAVLREE